MLTFESLPSPERHISRLETVAYLFGLESQPVEFSNVLEIACGTGRNLIPQALQYPNSKFLGFDKDQIAINQANKLKKDLGLDNIEFKLIDIRNYAITNQQFDYIICHGFFSWVNDQLKAEVYRICREGLRQNGVAYISHNSLPGWFERSNLQQMLCHTVQSDNNDEKIKLARKCLEDFINQNLFKSQAEKIEAENCLKQSDAFILHELLNPSSRAYHLNQISDLFAKEKLFYLGDSQVKRMRYLRFDEITQFENDETREEFKNFNRIQKEQHIDQIYPLSFRGSLFTKLDLRNNLIDFNKIKNLYLASPLLPKEEKIEIYNEYPVTFVGPQDSSAEIKLPFMKAFFLAFRQAWPSALPFNELYQLAEGLSGISMPIAELTEELSVFYCFGLLELSKKSATCDKLSNQASRLNLLESTFGNWITTKKHEYFPIDPFDKTLLELMQENLEKSNLIKKIIEKINKQELQVKVDSQEISSSELEELVAQTVTDRINWYHEQGVI